MRLSAKVIKNFSDINHFGYANQWEIRAGEPNTLYFQLVDMDQDGLRYMPQDPAVALSVNFPSVDDAKKITINAVQVTGDGSLWKIDLSSTQIPASGNVVFSITENNVTRKFSGINLMSVEYPGADGSC
jgi:hypothetical protein